MDEQEYRAIYTLEEKHWWYIGLQDLVFDSVSRYFKGVAGLKVLDGGCGTGAVLKRLLAGGNEAVGIDFSPLALGFCRERNIERLVRASVSGLPFLSGSFDLVVSLDVIYHAAVKDDVEALREFRRVLKKDGVLILNLPAYEFLRSHHDEANHTQRRYTKGPLADKLRTAGFEIEKITYRNTLLFPLIAGIRLLKKTFFKPQTVRAGSDLAPLPEPINRALARLLLLENAALRLTNLPFGTSLYCVARRA